MATARANFNSVISADATQFHATMRNVANSAKSVGRRISKSMGNATAAMGRVAASAKRATVAVGAIGAALTGAAAAGAGALIKSSSDIAANFETIRVTMGGYLKDLGKADEILAEIAAFSVVTPFETTGLQAATNTLLGAGIAGEEVVDVLKEIAAVAKSNQEVSELADALSKGFAKGKFQTEELNKFLERGINLHPELQKQVGLSGDAYTKAVEAGLRFNDVRSAIAAMSAEGGLYFGMLEEQSQTSIGLISTLSSNWDEFRLQFGKPINDALKPLFELLIKQVQSLTASGEKFGKIVGDAITKMVDKIKNVDFVGVGERFIAALNLENILKLLKATFDVSIAYFGNGLVKVFKTSAEIWGDEMMSALDDFIFTFKERFSKGLKDGIKTALKSKVSIFGFAKAVEDSYGKMDAVGYNLADKAIEKIKAEKDIFNLKAQTDNLAKVFSQIMGGAGYQIAGPPSPSPSTDGGGKPAEMDWERAERREKEKASRSRIPTLWADVITGEQHKAESEAKKRADEIARLVSRPQTDAFGNAFSGLNRATTMQLDRLTGIGPGTRTMLSGGPRTFGGRKGAISRDNLNGIGSGISTGGLGAKRAVGKGKDEAELKRQTELAKSSEEHLMDIKEKIDKSLSVA